MVKKLWMGLAVGTLLLGAVPAWAATINVGSGDSIQTAITAANPGDTINVAAGTYTEVGQIVINKNLSIVGADKATTIIKPNADTGSSGSAKGWWWVNPGVVFNLSGVTLDGYGYEILQGIRHQGTGTIQNVHFTNITYNASGPDYAGFAIYAFGQCGAVDVSDSVFDNIGREGIAYWGAGTTGTYTRNTYTGKGLGNWLDYGVEVTNGAVVTITGSTITNNRGIATSDGSNSAGIIVLLNSTATITGSTFTGNYYGINVGYASDTIVTPVAHAHNNNISDNYGFGARHASAYGTFDATNNWWGDSSGPSGGALDPVTFTPASGTGDSVSANVHFDPWLNAAVDGAETKEIPAATTEIIQNGELGIGADVTTNGNGSSTVTLVEYSDNPSGVAFNGSFYDLSISDTGNVDQIILKLYYNEPANKQVYWFDGSAWARCSNQVVVAEPVTIEGVTYDGRVEVTINDITTPSLADLQGTFFAMGSKSSTGDSGSLPVGPLAAGVSAFLVWWKRRKQE